MKHRDYREMRERRERLRHDAWKMNNTIWTLFWSLVLLVFLSIITPRLVEPIWTFIGDAAEAGRGFFF